MAIKRRKNPCRRRKSVHDREPNGKPQRTHQETILPETIMRRADHVGMKNATSERSAFPLGRLALNGVITERQYQAGRRFEDTACRWARLQGIKPHYPLCGEREQGMPSDPPEDAVSRASSAYFLLLETLDKLPQSGLVRATLESIILDHFQPPDRALPLILDTFRSGLNATAVHFGIEEREAA